MFTCCIVMVMETEAKPRGVEVERCRAGQAREMNLLALKVVLKLCWKYRSTSSGMTGLYLMQLD